MSHVPTVTRTDGNTCNRGRRPGPALLVLRLLVTRNLNLMMITDVGRRGRRARAFQDNSSIQLAAM